LKPDMSSFTGNNVFKSRIFKLELNGSAVSASSYIHNTDLQ